ncbi:Signal peptidase complex catalytic subunit [Stygiomarasmius scandens]|uniref:Signal peptidase complex catalytic subunit SEC11 n=1 Tax=Marasmiellus scandens TaxID=2682957 RepID=A0ABR1K0M1_9AGAR
MEPAFYRGDIIFLTNPSSSLYKTGDILVYRIPGKDIPIVHRVIEAHDSFSSTIVSDSGEGLWSEDAEPGLSHSSNSAISQQQMLTKGDNNPVDDLDLYEGLEWLEKKHIVGKVSGYIPYVGYITIYLVSARSIEARLWSSF